MRRLVIVVAALVATAAPTAYAEAQGAAAPPRGDPHARMNVTPAEYRRVSIGMDWAAVVAIVGSRGHAVEAQRGGWTTLTWAWMNADGSGMVCVFRDGRLVEKRQQGLEPSD